MDAWKANAHEYGPGRVHWVAGEDARTDRNARTLCGKWLRACPGSLIENARDSAVTCQICRNKIVNDRDRAQRQQEWEREAAQREAERIAEKARWENWYYNEYLPGPAWRELQRATFERDKHLCQGCRKAPAVLVHHLTYIRVGREMLFDLVALCRKCHDQIHHLTANKGESRANE